MTVFFYREIKDTEDTLKLQTDIDQLGCWASKWGMRFQTAKCNVMQIHVTRKQIKKIQVSHSGGNGLGPLASRDKIHTLVHKR